MPARPLRRALLAASTIACLGGMANAPATPASEGPSSSPPPLRIAVDEGLNVNRLLQQGAVAAHVLLRQGTRPRLVVAFPAGNSGVAVWWQTTSQPVHWVVESEPQATEARDARGRLLHGVSLDVRTDASALAVDRAVLSSVRVLRDVEQGAAVPPAVAVGPDFGERSVAWARDRADGAPGYRLAIEVLAGAVDHGRLVAPPDGALRLRLQAFTGETPLTPVAPDDLLEPGVAARDPRAADTLRFLAMHEKWLAGSWRFDTYFGRDTLITARLLAPVLRPARLEDALRSVLERLSPAGEVAHEEGIGEFAVLAHGGQGDAPVLDHAMIDGDFLLPVVAAHVLLDDPRERARAAAFLASPAGDGETVGHALVRNLVHVAAQARPFAERPSADRLVRLKPGRRAGDWRDSDDGLGGGVRPWDVDVVLVPAALRAASRLVKAGSLDPWLSDADRERLAGVGGDADTWAREAPRFFRVRRTADEARRQVNAYAKAQGLDPRAARASLPRRGSLAFDALSLDEGGRPVPVLHSDGGFLLLFGEPTPTQVRETVDAIARPFPAGLVSEAGLIVANPAYAPASLQARFGRGAYHGTVVWSWQQALLLAGLDRQAARRDLPSATRARVRALREALARRVAQAASLRNSELWTWTTDGHGGLHAAPFGAGSADADETNAAQLWSTVFLGLPAPSPR